MAGGDPNSKHAVGIVSVDLGTPLYTATFALGEAQKEWIGPLTFAAWREYAEGGRIWAAVEHDDPDRPLAYLAFRLPRAEVVIAHLVVAPEARGRGLARTLVDELSRRHRDRVGISLLCRRDYPAHTLWPTLGFVPRGDKRGRGRDGKPLTRWWFDHGQPHLLSWSGATDDRRAVVLDNNVFLDLEAAPADRDVSTEPILTDTLAGRIELVLTPEIHTEIDRDRPAKERQHLHSVADTYPSITVTPDDLLASQNSLHAALKAARSGWAITTNKQDLSDLKHLAYTAAGGVGIFVTRDERVLSGLRRAADKALGVTIAAPKDLVTVIDEAENSSAYIPAALLGTGYTAAPMGSDEGDLAYVFLDQSRGERKRDLRTALRDLASRGDHAVRLVYRNPDGRPVALLGATVSVSQVNARIMRLKPGALSPSLAAQMVTKLREIAVEHRASVVRLDDPHCDEAVRTAADVDGFFDVGGAQVGLVSTLVVHMGDLEVVIGELAQAVNMAELPPLLQVGTDSMTEELLVPIKPPYSSQLFHAPRQLYGPPDHLGISREHVYYRAARSAGEQAPGRILWYSSAPESNIVACSTLIGVEQGGAEELWRRNRRLGIYSRQQVTATADQKGNVRALHVVDTEVFNRPVSLSTLRRLSSHHGHTLQLRSPSKIKGGLFEAILKEGRT